MKKLGLVVVLGFMFFSSVVSAQEKKYITYKTEKGEDIKDLAKRFGLKSKELLGLNPDINKKPVEGTFILIPNPNFKDSSSEVKKKLHEVKAKETLYGISKKYGINVENLTQANIANLADGLKTGMFLEIPTASPVLTAVKSSGIKTHLVVKDDTVYSLTRLYGVSFEELVLANPFLKDGLKLGTQLIVPSKVHVIKNAELLIKEVEVVKETSINKINKDTVEVAFLLPFKFSTNLKLSKEKLFSQKDNLNNIVTDFYLGAQLAIDSLRKQGRNFRIKVYDTGNNKDTLQALITSKRINNTDIFFGPIYNSNAEFLAGKLKNKPVVFPFYSSKQESFVIPNLVKTQPDKKVYEECVVSYLKKIGDKEQIIIVGANDALSLQKMELLKKKIQGANTLRKILFLTPRGGYIQRSQLLGMVDATKDLIIVLATENNVITSDIINNLNTLPLQQKIRLLSFEKGDNFNRVENSVLTRLNFTYATTGVLSKNVKFVDDFYEKYLQANNAYPTDYAVRGYDVVFDVISKYKTNTESILKSVNKLDKTSQIQNSFLFERNSAGSISNKAVHLVRYTPEMILQEIN